MAVCTACEQEMTKPTACTQRVFDDFPDGVVRERIPYPADTERPCHDCYAPPGGLHHPGCDAERCPRCGGQAIGCSCTDDDEDGYDDGLSDAERIALTVAWEAEQRGPR